MLFHPSCFREATGAAAFCRGEPNAGRKGRDATREKEARGRRCTGSRRAVLIGGIRWGGGAGGEAARELGIEGWLQSTSPATFGTSSFGTSIPWRSSRRCCSCAT